MNRINSSCLSSYGNLFALLLLLMNTGCNAQGNALYIGKQYGVFDLDKITFSEQPDTLLSKVEKYYKLPQEDGYFDEQQKAFVTTGILYHIYRMLPRYVSTGMFTFKQLQIPSKQVIDFYADQSGNLRKVEFSVYLGDKEYQDLRAACKDFKDVTTEQISRLNNGNYKILQYENPGKTIQTTLYCLDNRKERNSDDNQHYFVRISSISLKNRNDRVYQQLNDEVKRK